MDVKWLELLAQLHMDFSKSNIYQFTSFTALRIFRTTDNILSGQDITGRKIRLNTGTSLKHCHGWECITTTTLGLISYRTHVTYPTNIPPVKGIGQLKCGKIVFCFDRTKSKESAITIRKMQIERYFNYKSWPDDNSIKYLKTYYSEKIDVQYIL